MKKRCLGMLGLVVVLGLAAMGCGGGGDEGGDYHPAVDVNGKWDVRMDGAPIGVMTLTVSSGGSLAGWFHTTQDVTGRLAGSMDGYVAEFTLTFANGVYLGTLLFNQDASGASGSLMDDKGFKRLLVLTPQVAG